MVAKDPPKMVRPPNVIKQKMGPAANMRDLLKPEKIQAGQRVIEDKKASFLEWAQEDLNVLSATLREIQQSQISSTQFERMLTAAEQMRDRGGTFGYTLLSAIAKSLVNYCAAMQNPTPHDLIVIGKHVEGMHTILLRNIEGEGGMLGVELLSGLKQLITKYQS